MAVHNEIDFENENCDYRTIAEFVATEATA